MMATEATKILLGLDSQLAGRLWVYDALAGSTKTLGIRQRTDCPVCGADN
jgi:molybdopterin/thiamine biosynthesis adenylyltransferase